jgi:thiol-disulfide isomerase/thioredoxin
LCVFTQGQAKKIKIHMMVYKVIGFAGLVMVAALATAQQKPFTITGNIRPKTNGYVYLSYSDEASGYKKDSALIKNGHFTFNGNLVGPTQAMVSFSRQPMSFDEVAQLYLVPSKMQLSLDKNNISAAPVLKGSPVQAEADALTKAKEPIMAQLKPLLKTYDRLNAEYRDAIKAKKDEATLEGMKDAATKAKDAMDPYYEQLREIEIRFMDEHPGSFVTASLLPYRISSMDLQEGEERFNKLPEDIKKSSLGQGIRADLDRLRKGSPGAKAFVFSSKELRGSQLSLTDYKGKYVLLDFWASWCVPCRKGNPHLLSLYSKYKDKGFEIIGISDDDGKPEAWEKAVDKDGIGVWKHVLRGLKWNGNSPDKSTDISDNFGIHSLPTKILIDPKGVIIGRYGGGGDNDEAMDKKLSEIFGG